MKYKRKFIIIDQFVTFAGPDDYVEVYSHEEAMRWWVDQYGKVEQIIGFAECEEGNERFIVRNPVTLEDKYYIPVFSKKVGQ